MPFGIVGRTGPGMRQLVGFGDRSTGTGFWGANWGRAIVTNDEDTNQHTESQNVWRCDGNYDLLSRVSLHYLIPPRAPHFTARSVVIVADGDPAYRPRRDLK